MSTLLFLGSDRRDDHIESAGETLDIFFDLIRRFDQADEFLEGVPGQILMGLFTASQDDVDFHLVTLAQEFVGLGFFEIQIVFVGPDAEADAFDFDFFLLGFRNAQLFGLLVEIFAVVHDLTNRDAGLGGNLHQIQGTFTRDGYPFRRGNFAEAGAVLIDDQHQGDPDLLIDPEVLRTLLLFWFESKSLSYGFVGLLADLFGRNEKRLYFFMVELMGIAPMSKPSDPKSSTSLVRFIPDKSGYDSSE